MSGGFEDFCRFVLELRNSAQPFVVITLTGERGHAPQDLGARMVVADGGRLYGTVGGGKIEKAAIDRALNLLAHPVTRVEAVRWNLQRDIGMSCGGEVDLLFEVHHPALDWSIVLFGAGHIVQELAPLLLRLDCRLRVVDSRSEWLLKIKEHPRLEKILSPVMSDQVAHLKPQDHVAIITMGHSTDFPILRAILDRECEFPFVGVIGSPVKRIKIDRELRDLGVSEKKIQFFQCPIGEDYGKNHPAEIAISVAVELLRARKAKSDQIFPQT